MRFSVAIAVLVFAGSSGAQGQGLLETFVKAGCEVVSAQMVMGEAQVTLNCKALMESVRKTGKTVDGQEVKEHDRALVAPVMICSGKLDGMGVQIGQCYPVR